MYLVHIAAGTVAATLGYVLGIYFPLMPMPLLVVGGLLYRSIIAHYQTTRAAELQLLLDAQPQPVNTPPEALDDKFSAIWNDLHKGDSA
jgi:hypothetical protein